MASETPLQDLRCLSCNWALPGHHRLHDAPSTPQKKLLNLGESALEMHLKRPPLVAAVLELQRHEEWLLLRDLLIEALHHCLLCSRAHSAFK